MEVLNGEYLTPQSIVKNFTANMKKLDQEGVNVSPQRFNYKRNGGHYHAKRGAT